MKLVQLIAILVLMAQTLMGSGAVFHADSLHGSLGDVITFGWSISHDSESAVTVSEYDLDGTGIEVLDQQQVVSSSGTELIFNTAIYDSVGVYQFPPVTAYITSINSRDSVLLDGPYLEIFSILSVSDTTFRDIKGLHAIKLPFNIFILVWLIVALVVLYVVIKLFKRFTRKEKVLADVKIIVPPEEAHIIALRDLETLKRSKYLRFEQFKEFYSELTHILKSYYENRYLIDALELTTSELMEKTTGMVEFDAAMTESTRQILETADYIKFAKGTSNEVESGEALSRTILMVKETMIKDDQGEDT